MLGGSVFVGRRLVDELLAGGHDVTVLNRGRTATDLPAEVERLAADRTDVDAMRGALAGRDWDAIYDVSGFVMVAGGADISGLLDLVEGHVGHYVYVSSIMAYDQSWSGVVPWTEDQPTDQSGAGTYGGFKALAEAAMLDRRSRRGFPVSVVRPAAIYGPRNNIYDMETPMFVRLVQGRPILLPHSGLVTASYGHVDDLCALMVAMIGVDAAMVRCSTSPPRRSRRAGTSASWRRSSASSRTSSRSPMRHWPTCRPASSATSSAGATTPC